jgi:alkylhydroperoxidase family enzyme
MPSRITPLPVELPDRGPMTDMARTGMGIWAHRPEIRAAYDQVYAALAADTATLSPRLAELLRLRIAFHNQCRSCMAVRYEPELVGEDLVCSLEKPEEAADLTDAERVALRFADCFATNHLAIDDALMDELREHYEEGELVELSAMCALYVGIGRLMATWRIVDDLPASFRAPAEQRVTPWGHDDAIKASARRSRRRASVA